MRITIVTDSHLAPSAPACCANWRAGREYAAWSASELTVHLGDISLDAASDSSQLEAARAMCESWPTSFRFLPGNHDIEDNPPGPEHSAPQPLQRELLERFRILFGPDYWSMAVDGWFVIGLNAQLCGTDSRLETDQWRWFSECVREAGRRPVALMLHKPLFQLPRPGRAIHRSSRERGWRRFAPHEAVFDAPKIGMRNHLETEPLVQENVLFDVGLEVRGRALLVDPIEERAQQCLPDTSTLELRIYPDRPQVPMGSILSLIHISEPTRPY